MNRVWVSGLLILAAMGVGSRPADAGYCGLASYQHGATKLTTVSFARARRACSSCERAEPTCAAATCCETRMVKDVVYEQKQYTCYKTVCERVVEQKEIDCVRYEKEQCFREVEYTVCKPVWETRTRSIPYTVCKPVITEREESYTVQVPVQEKRTGTRTVCKQVQVPETRTVCEDQGH